MIISSRVEKKAGVFRKGRMRTEIRCGGCSLIFARHRLGGTGSVRWTAGRRGYWKRSFFWKGEGIRRRLGLLPNIPNMEGTVIREVGVLPHGSLGHRQLNSSQTLKESLMAKPRNGVASLERQRRAIQESSSRDVH